MDITDLYATIAEGKTPELSDEDLRWVRKPLYEKALREVDATKPAGRLGALRVAAWLGLDRAIAVPAKLVRDADRSVRVSAFNLAVTAGDAGRALLRDLLLGTDEELAAASLDLLARAHDQAALGAARRRVASGHVSVRVAAITVVGLVGGASTRPALSPRPDDPDRVRDAKVQALAWIDGDTPRPAPTPWWEEGPHAISPQGELVGPNVAPVHIAAASPPPAKSSAPADDEDPLPSASDTATAPEAAEGALVPVHTADSAAGADSTGLPDPLPDEPRALAKLYGMVGEADRARLLPTLEAVEGSALAKVWMNWSSGSDAAVGRGIALAAAHLGRRAFLTKARSLVRAPDAGVRSAAAEALGALGGASTLMALRSLLTDDDPTVRAATIRALQSLGHRVDRESMAHSWASALSSDEAPEVVEALAAWPAP